MMYNYDNRYGMFGGWAMIIPLVLLIILIFVVYKLITLNSTQNSAIDELDRRFARGELSEDEYLRKKSIINNK